MNDEEEAYLKSIISSLLKVAEGQKKVQNNLAKELENHRQTLETVLNTQAAFLRRIEILELRLDIEDPK